MLILCPQAEAISHTCTWYIHIYMYNHLAIDQLVLVINTDDTPASLNSYKSCPPQTLAESPCAQHKTGVPNADSLNCECFVLIQIGSRLVLLTFCSLCC